MFFNIRISEDNSSNSTEAVDTNVDRHVVDLGMWISIPSQSMNEAGKILLTFVLFKGSVTDGLAKEMK